MSDAELNERINTISSFLRDFNIGAEVVDYDCGPVITRFALQLNPGVAASNIERRLTDLSRYLRQPRIRCLPVLQGTSYMALEIPNQKRRVTMLRDVVSQESFFNSSAQLPLCLGTDVVGSPVITDLARAPHLLVAGTTGSGKSVGVHSMLLSLLLRRSPAELRLILVDPKRNEFLAYDDLPHLITPCIYEPKGAIAALKWCVVEMERRYELLAGLRLRQLSEYNQLLTEAARRGERIYDPTVVPAPGAHPQALKPLPYLVVVIDEYADLMLSVKGAARNAETSPEALIARLTAKARAAGIHLVLATQTPRADIVTGRIKANMPSRVAYTVQSNTDSRVILDESGAENLLGHGDMIVKVQDLEGGNSFRAHGPLASGRDVDAVVNAWKEHGETEYIEGVAEDDESEENTGGSDAGGRENDQMFDRAVEYARVYESAHGKPVSISQLQVEFRIGYQRAKRLYTQMENQGCL